MAHPHVHRAEEVLPVEAPPARHRGAHGEELEPYYVWDLVVRITHWVIALAIVVLSVTGVYLGRPFVAAPGPASQHFIMGWAKVLHFYAAIAFTLAVMARILWLVIGPRRSNWRQLVPTSKRRLRDMKDTLLFYLMVRDRPPATIGHNPLAGATYIAVFGLYLVMILTGFALYSVSSYSYMEIWQFLLPWFGGVQWTRWIHHVGMWLLIVFVVSHMYTALLTSRVEKNGAIDSMFSGYKFLPKDMPEDDE